MSKITTLRLPSDMAREAEVFARVQGISFNAFIVRSVEAEIERVRANKNLMKRARAALDRDRDIIDKPAD
jgi:hypothetical protein